MQKNGLIRFKYYKYVIRLLIFVPILIFILFGIQFTYINRFNSREYTVTGADTKKKTYMDLEPREDSTSSWLKRDFEWNGETIDLKAQTIDGVLYNNSTDTVDKWSMTINIKDDCFVNNAWCGTVEIHQYVGTADECVQKLDLRDYDLEEVKLDYFYDGDLLIPLKKGDFVNYFPSVKDNEMPIEGESDMTMGVIFYYFDSLDFMEAVLDYSYHRNYTFGTLYNVILVLGLLWLFGLVVHIVTVQIVKNAQKQLELKKSGLSCMSDIYQGIYILDLEKDELIHVVEKEDDMFADFEGDSAGEKLSDFIATDADDAYLDIVKEFCDLSTLAHRIGDKNSLALDYISKNYGWCSIRFFAMDRIAGMEPEKVLFTIRSIDAEKREMDAIEERVSRVERENREMGAFLQAVSDEILVPTHVLMEQNEMILSDTNQPEVAQYAASIKRCGTTLTEIMYDVLDYAQLESGQVSIAREPVALDELLIKVKDFLEELIVEAPIELKFDIGKDLPKAIYGDRKRLERILMILCAVAHNHATDGCVTISLFGRKTPAGIHILFSVRDDGDGLEKETSRKIGTRLVEGLLHKMGSKLNIVNTPEEGTEAYFELDTKIAEEAPLKLDF